MKFIRRLIFEKLNNIKTYVFVCWSFVRRSSNVLGGVRFVAVGSNDGNQCGDNDKLFKIII